MGLEAILTLAVLAAAVALFISEKLGVDIVALLVLASLALLGLVTPSEALSGFSSQATVTVAAMFVLSGALAQTGALRAVGRWFARIRQEWLFTLTVTATLGAVSAFVNNTAAVAIFLPVVLGVAAANRFSPSRVLIPMSYAAQMGGVCTLIGTSTNLLVHAMAQDLGLPGFSLFEFAPLGLITMAVGLVYLMLAGPLLLPNQRTSNLAETYELGKYITELRVSEGSPLLGKSVAEARLTEKYGVYVLELLHGEEKSWAPRAQKLAAGDVLLVNGDWTRLMSLKDEAGLALEPEFSLRDGVFADADLTLAEVMVAPGSRFVGQTLAQLDFQWNYNAAPLAIHRRGEVVREKLKEVRLAVGDVLLLLVPVDEMRVLRRNRHLIVLSEKEGEQRPRWRAFAALGIMVAVVALAATNLMPIAIAAILGCIALVLTGCISSQDAYQAIDWRVIILLGGVLPLGIALQKSGAAAFLAEHAMGAVDGFGPIAALATIYLLTAVLTEFMSNNAAAALMTPVAVASAQALDINPTSLVVAVAFAASTAFATPVGYQTNTMVYNAGGYRFIDFVRIGIPLNLLFWGVATYFIPKFWPL